jgi:phosphoenolpyruvate-protein phosphotransferase
MAPLSGVIVRLDDVPDPVFAQRMAGDGASIDPLSNRVLAPCDARVLLVHRAGHALTLDASGIEIIIHVGIDTVQLKGDGFEPLVKAGDQVRTGDPLIVFDADLVARRARSLLTQILVSGLDRKLSMEPQSGKVVAGRDVLMRVVASEEESGSLAAGSGGAVTSSPIVVASETGLHARPAAVLATAARRFTSDLRLIKKGQEANIRSVVSILALEVARGETVTVVGRGDDAREAVAAIVETLTTELTADAHALRDTTETAAPVLALPETRSPSVEGALRGVPVSPGVVIGSVFQLRHDDVVPEERAADPNQERRALDAAIAAAHLQLEALRARLMAEADTDKAAIFAAHQELLEDPEVLDRAAADIRGGASAAYAWRQAYGAQAQRLLALKSQLFAGRAADLRDVGRRVLHLLVGREAAPQELPPDSIVVAEDLAPSDAASLDRTRMRGFCTTMGSATSHVSILARGMGIPAVAGIDPRVLDIANGTRVVLDGDAGTLKASPTAAEEAEVARRRQADDRRRSSELSAAGEPAVTKDGHRVEVVANIGDQREAQRVVQVGAEGVGLLRTEFLFMDRREAPGEDEQAKTYETIARTLGPDRILVIRTLDVGGDKPLGYLPMATEANPFLGERGIRLTLNRPEIFIPQIRAILRASRAGKVAMMFPMVSTLQEWRAAREMVERERAALGIAPIQIGIMVETSAIALMSERFARDADFFSIGTNDLTQYTLAMDRSNPRLAPQMDALHPAVLRLIERTVAGARAHKRWVGVCGALAGDPAAVPVLLGLDVDELSADVPLVPSVKARIRTLSLEECRLTAREALDAADAEEVRAIVSRRHP